MKVVDDVIDEAGFGMFQVLIIVASGILWVSFDRQKFESESNYCSKFLPCSQ